MCATAPPTAWTDILALPWRFARSFALSPYVIIPARNLIQDLLFFILESRTDEVQRSPCIQLLSGEINIQPFPCLFEYRLIILLNMTLVQIEVKSSPPYA